MPIVHPAAGTTRDVLTASTALDGWPVELSDTAGLRSSEHPIEREAIQLTYETLAGADLVVLVFDSTEPWSDSDARLIEAYPEAIVLHNKMDLPSSPGPPRPPGLAASAMTGEGLDRVIRAMVERLIPSPPFPGEGVPFTLTQIEQLRSAANAIARGDRQRALGELDRRQFGIPPSSGFP